MLAFVARTPAKVVLVDSWRHRRLPRTRVAALVAAAEIAVLVVLLGVAAATASGPIVARAVASLPFVRFQLRRVKRQPHRRWAQDMAQGAAVALAAIGVFLGWLPVVAAGAVVALAMVQLVLARTRPPPALIVGVQQLVFGLAVMIAAGLALATT